MQDFMVTGNFPSIKLRPDKYNSNKFKACKSFSEEMWLNRLLVKYKKYGTLSLYDEEYFLQA